MERRRALALLLAGTGAACGLAACQPARFVRRDPSRRLVLRINLHGSAPYAPLLLMRERRLLEILRLTRKQNRPMACRLTALDFGYRLRDVPERQRAHREQARRIGARPLGEKVVVRLHARELETVVVHAQKILRAEAADVRIDHLCPNAFAVHVREPRTRVVRRGIEELYHAFTDNALDETQWEGDRYFRLRTIRRLLSEGQLDQDLRRSRS